MEALLPSIRRIVAAADPQQPISDVQLVSDIVREETAPRRVQVRVLGAFALVAFFLAGLGLHGLLAYNVSQGARDIGVRLALGAERQASFGGAVALALGMTTLGSLLPALRAVRVDPLQVMRAE